MTKKAHVNFFHGDKGGVGKSFLAKAYIDYLLSRKLPVTPIESDTRNPDIQRLFSKFTNVVAVDLREEHGWARLFEYLESAEGNFAVSLPAGIGAQAERYGEIFLEAAKEHGVPITVWWVLSDGFDSTNFIERALRQDSGLIKQAVTVRNEFFGPDFIQWRESSARKQFMDIGGQEIAFPMLTKRLADKVAERELTFSQACGDTGFSMFDRISLTRWVQQVHAAFDGLHLPMVQSGGVVQECCE